MITNLIATVLISVVTNWVDVHEMIPYYCGQNLILCDSTIYVTNYPAISQSMYQPANFIIPAPTKDKYIGKDGTVVKITEIKFMYDSKEQIHRIEEPLEKIIMRCTEKPLPPTEYIWQKPIRESLTNTITNNVQPLTNMWYK